MTISAKEFEALRFQSASPSVTPQEIIEKARKLPKKTQNNARAVWQATYDEIIAQANSVPKKKRLKSFEVHHTVEKARAAFLGALVEGKTLDECRALALAVAQF